MTASQATCAIPKVFSEKQIFELGSITRLRTGIAEPCDAENGSLKDAEVLFST